LSELKDLARANGKTGQGQNLVKATQCPLQRFGTLGGLPKTFVVGD
jgi:hypothetical protein